MKRTAIIALLVVAGLVVGAGPIAALSCAEPEPFDMEAAIADADAAAIGTITSVSPRSKSESEDAELVVTVEVTEVFKGTMPSRLVLDRTTSVWGPYFDEGAELALLAKNGVVGDGQNSLCGPFYTAAEMREAGGEPMPPTPPTPIQRMIDFLRNLVDWLVFP